MQLASLPAGNDDVFSNIAATRTIQKLYFEDQGQPSFVSGSADQNEKSRVVGLFAHERLNNKQSLSQAAKQRQSLHAYIVSGTLRQADQFRNGIEISSNTIWSSGLVKMWSGDPGHIIKSPNSYGVVNLDIVDSDSFKEIDTFNPVEFIKAQADEAVFYHYQLAFTYPIVTSDVNQRENSIFNGIIEAMPIREIISFFSINVPFEPRGVVGDFGGGNYRRLSNSTDQVLTVEEFNPSIRNKTPYADLLDDVTVTKKDAYGNSYKVHLGYTMGYFSQDYNKTTPFVDEVNPRDHTNTGTYAEDMISVIRNMPPKDNYVREKQRASTSGFVYDSTIRGTDSLAFGGLTYT